MLRLGETMVALLLLQGCFALQSFSSEDSGVPSSASSSTLPWQWVLPWPLPLPHEFLPPPLADVWEKYVLWRDVPRADSYLLLASTLLAILAIIQSKAFARPPPIPLKRLPRRPTIHLRFQPDGGPDTNKTSQATGKAPAAAAATATTTTRRGGPGMGSEEEKGQQSSSPTGVSKHSNAPSHPAVSGLSSRRLFRRQRRGRSRPNEESAPTTSTKAKEEDDGMSSPPWGWNDGSSDNDFFQAIGNFDNVNDDDDGDDDDDDDADSTDTAKDEGRDPATDTATSLPPFVNDLLPDSFAPLLSSSHVEILTEHLTADLIHAVHVEAGVRMREGRHEIPFDKDASRPQLLLEVPKGGVRLSAAATVGSDGLSSNQDLDVTLSTTSRSKPMVKNAGIAFDPPLPLSNVAPTLIYFPTLFEDSAVPALRRIQIFRYLLDFVVSISTFLERCLWILESKCQIHLSKIRIVPLYKGRKRDDNSDNHHPSPEWRLQLSFSGHLLLFGWIPIPFISVALPTFIIPQPHALLDHLLSSQPLASARIRRENIAERRIALALLGTAESWTCQIQVVATPPAAGVDVTLPGGVAVAVELGLGRDPHAGRSRHSNAKEESPIPTPSAKPPGAGGGGGGSSVNSMSSWTTKDPSESGAFRASGTALGGATPPLAAFDANDLVPWKVELSAKGSVSHDKLSFHILKLAAEHEGIENAVPVSSKFGTRGSMAVWKYRPDEGSEATPRRHRRLPSIGSRKTDSFGHFAEESPSVAAVLLFPEETESFHRSLRFLQYDYAFDVFEHSKLDSITITVGATHPMLDGGTMVTTILDSIYAYGSVAARDDAILDPDERKRKRNVLRHLPATDFTLGVSNVYIPPESYSYSDDGQTLFVPDASGGRMMIRILGGIDVPEDASFTSNVTQDDMVYDGVKVVADFEIPSLIVRSEGRVKEFPELDIFDGVKLHSHMSGIISGSVRAHLRPERVSGPVLTTGRNVFNPLEAYEIDFSKSSLAVKIKEYTASLGHRRIIFPAESTIVVKVIESIVDLTFEGKTQCDLSWDFQGLSPILQVTQPGKSPAEATPEDKQQMSLLVAPLRQGRLSLNVSSVGGINITKAATSREDKEGLYDWKFFNALVSPDQDSFGRILNVLHDKRTMEKLLQVIHLVNKDLHKILRYILRQVWRAKELLDQEGISDPGHIIPMYKMARLISLFIKGEMDEVERILPIIDRVVRGDGLDIVEVKELLRENLDNYEDWAPELDRAVRWAAVFFGPMSGIQPFVEENVAPLEQLPHYESILRDIPTAQQLYETLLDKRQLPLEPSFSSLVSRVAPYLTFKQIEFFLETRGPSDWQPADLKRIRYVYTIKRKVLEIAESYGGLSFLPQSFLVSVFLGEATRTSLRVSFKKKPTSKRMLSTSSKSSSENRAARIGSKMSRLRRRRGANLESKLQQVAELSALEERIHEDGGLIPTERVAYLREFNPAFHPDVPQNLVLELGSKPELTEETYELGDSLLGPQDVAILLQAGLTSAMKASTVVQLNQRMLLDLICSQPRSFAVAVLAEIGSPSGQGSPRGLTSALMSLLELDQGSFKTNHRIDMNELLESWLPGLKIPRREDYLAGGRWARQSYYEALYSVATSILEDAESYTALKLRLQRLRTSREDDPIPQPRQDQADEVGMDLYEGTEDSGSSKLQQAVSAARSLIDQADTAGKLAIEALFRDSKSLDENLDCQTAKTLYLESFQACSKLLSLDKFAFHASWFREFYKRNYDALMILSLYDNVIDDIDHVRHWLHRLLLGAKKSQVDRSKNLQERVMSSSSIKELSETPSADTGPSSQLFMAVRREVDYSEDIFLRPENSDSQQLIDAILDAVIYEESDRERLRRDPLVRLLLRNPPGHYDFTIVTAMGVVTEGKKGIELADAFARLERLRGVKTIRSDTATARSFEYNAGKIEEAIESAIRIGRPYGYLGYSQGCANALMAESTLLSGTPKQQLSLQGGGSALVCRQLLFSASNGSFHGPAMEKKIQRLIVMCEEFFKYQQGYVSRALSSTVLEMLNNILDSAHFHKFMGGAQSFLPEGCRFFWREAQHLGHVPTCTLRGVMEDHTTPECLEMISHLLTKQSGSALHDSQVHAFDAVGHPVYHHNRNGRILKQCDVGEGAVQRTHHWSPLSDEVEFVRTAKDVDMGSFDCAKDRHVFPWVDVNVRLGFVKYAAAHRTEPATESGGSDPTTRLSGTPHSNNEWHPSKLVEAAKAASVST